MKIRKISWTAAVALVMIGGLIQPSLTQAAPLATGVHVSTKAVKKCTLKKGAACRGKGVSKQKIGKKNLSGVKLSKGKITGSKFTGTTLSKADFSGATISDTTFSNANLKDANFKGATLKNVTFSAGTNLSSVDMSGATIDSVKFDHANVTGSSNFRIRSIVPDISCDFNHGSCTGLDFANADIGKIDFAFSNASNSNFTGATISRLQIDFGSANNLNFSKSKIQNLDLEFTQVSSSNFSNAKIANASIAYSDFNQNELIGTHIDYLNTDFSHVNSNAYVNAVCGTFDNFHTTFTSSYYLWSDSCQSKFTAVSGLNSVVNSHGQADLVITSDSSASISKIIVERSGQGATYRTTCTNLASCISFLDKGIAGSVQIFSGKKLTMTAPGFSCSSSSRQANGGYYTECTLQNVSGSTYSIDAVGPPLVRVDGVRFDDLTKPQVFASIVIKVDGNAVKTCTNVSSCSVEVSDGDSVSVFVTSTASEIWIQQSSPEIDTSLGNFDPIVGGIYRAHTNAKVVHSSVVFQALLS